MKHYLKRPALDSQIGIFNPSDALDQRRFEALDMCVGRLSKTGTRAVFGNSVYLADVKFEEESICVRASDISNLLLDESIGLLLAAWGGKASNQLLDRLPYSVARSAAKPIVGFSDTTVLLNAISERSGIVTFLGPNVAGKLDETEFGDLGQFQAGFSWKGFSPFNAADIHVVKSGFAIGKIFGGNLKCFCLGLLLSHFRLDHLQDGIFLIEDTSSSALEIEQILVSLYLSGFLSRVRGIIFSPGSSSGRPKEVQRNMSVREILSRTCSEFSIPIITIDSFGHGKRPNPALPIGAEMILAPDKGTIIINEDIFEL